MRIGILTQALHGNYGGILQNFALQQVLKKMGHQPITIDRHISRPESWKKRILKIIFRNLRPTYDSSLLTKAERKAITFNQLQFVKHFICRIGPIESQIEFDKAVSDPTFDAFIVGSDQCWRPCYSANIGNYYLDFVKSRKIKRIAYAASFGVDKWEYTEGQTQTALKAIKELNAVSVREYSGIELCRCHFGLQPQWVLDPTMLLGVDDFKKFINTEKTGCSFVTVYLLEQSPKTSLLIERIKDYTGAKGIKYNNSNNKFKRGTNIGKYRDISVEEWIDNIANAEYVLTDSFHGAVFSILFNVPFMVILNDVRGNTRIESLLKDFDLEQCIYDTSASNIFPSIDWKRVNAYLNQRRNESMNFLKEALK